MCVHIMRPAKMALPKRSYYVYKCIVILPSTSKYEGRVYFIECNQGWEWASLPVTRIYITCLLTCSTTDHKAQP